MCIHFLGGLCIIVFCMCFSIYNSGAFCMCFSVYNSDAFCICFSIYSNNGAFCLCFSIYTVIVVNFLCVQYINRNGAFYILVVCFVCVSQYI